jgi:hypothetical protein
MKYRICAAILAASAGIGLSGCATDGYGYSGVSLGYASSGYYGDPYWGWYDDYYYPGTGYYIYDRGGHRHRWNDSQRRYWEGRRGNRRAHANWSGYRNGMTSAQRQQRREAWRAQHPQGSSATSESRAARRQAWRAQHQSQAQSGTSHSWRGRGNWSGGDRRHRRGD